jgi:hypothetical protein
MATITVLKAIITQIKDVQKAEDDACRNTFTRSDAFYDLGEAVWHLESAIRKMQGRRT